MRQQQPTHSQTSPKPRDEGFERKPPQHATTQRPAQRRPPQRTTAATTESNRQLTNADVFVYVRVCVYVCVCLYRHQANGIPLTLTANPTAISISTLRREYDLPSLEPPPPQRGETKSALQAPENTQQLWDQAVAMQPNERQHYQPRGRKQYE